MKIAETIMKLPGMRSEKVERRVFAGSFYLVVASFVLFQLLEGVPVLNYILAMTCIVSFVIMVLAFISTMLHDTFPIMVRVQKEE